MQYMDMQIDIYGQSTTLRSIEKYVTPRTPS